MSDILDDVFGIEQSKPKPKPSLPAPPPRQAVAPTKGEQADYYGSGAEARQKNRRRGLKQKDSRSILTGELSGKEKLGE